MVPRIEALISIAVGEIGYHLHCLLSRIILARRGRSSVEIVMWTVTVIVLVAGLGGLGLPDDTCIGILGDVSKCIGISTQKFSVWRFADRSVALKGKSEFGGFSGRCSARAGVGRRTRRKRAPSEEHRGAVQYDGRLQTTRHRPGP